MKTSRAAALLVSDTEANGTELEWLLDRWTFDITPSDRAYLGQRAEADRAREVLVQGIITGTDTVTRGSQWLTSKLPLRDYQQVAVDMIRATGSTLIVDELGLGKTLVGLALLEDPDARPGLAVTLTGWLGQQWLQELRKFYPELRGVEIKTTKAEEEFPRLWKDEKFGYDLVVINYAKLASWRHHLAGTVRTVIFDEAQELRRPESLKYEAAAHIASRSRVVTGLTATPIFNYGGEMYSLMDGIRQGCLGDREEFMREWAGFGSLSADNNGKVRIENPEALRTHLAARGLFLRRTREDVGISLPAIETVEQYVPSDPDTLNKLSGDAIEMARLLLSQDSTNTQKWQSARDLDWRMRHDTGVAKAPFVADFVKLLLSSEDKIVLFGWHRACFAAGTQAVMFDGSTRAIEDIVVGDQLMGPDSTPRTVKDLIRGHGRLFRVVPTKGTPWVCSEHHVLTVWNTQARRYEKWTVAEFLSRSPRWQRDRVLYHSQTITYPHEIDPDESWLLGYWLGDGAANLRDLRVISADPEIDAEVSAIAKRHGLTVSRWPAPGASGMSTAAHLAFSSGLHGPKARNALLNHFRGLGLDNNKHIPHSYLTATVSARLELLAGLIDSDGHMYTANGVGTAEFVNTNANLAADVARLARSLGFAAYIREWPRKPASGFGSTRAIHRVTISGDVTQIPTRIARKRGAARSGQKDVLHVGFQIERCDDSGDYFGFEVDGDHLFLLEDYTVVHNCYDIWMERLAEFNPAMYTGSESSAAKALSIKRFLHGDARILIMSLRSGAGIDGLQNAASTLVFGELDWSPGVHRQAIGRLGRPGQTRPVLAYFCTTDDGADPVMLDTLNIKSMEADRLIEPEQPKLQVVSEEGVRPDRIKLLAESVLERAGSLPQRRTA